MKNKGFTMAELISVIVIMGILIAIIVPTASKVIENSRKNAFRESLRSIIRKTEMYMEDNNLTSLPEDGISLDDENIDLGITSGLNGVVKYDGTDVILESINNGRYCGKGTKDNLTVDEYKVDTCNVASITQVFTYEYTGAVKQINLERSGRYKLEVWGASGATATVNGPAAGGSGGYTVGELTITSLETVYINIGGKGLPSKSNITVLGGYNGGGASVDIWTSGVNSGGSGGGGTDIRIKGTSLYHRLIVAGGGGAGVSWSTNINAAGGSGGGLVGIDGFASGEYNERNRGLGGTQTSGGGINTGTQGSTPGSFGQGGQGKGSNPCGAGGGGGWYGGGGGSVNGGGGGSGWVYTASTFTTWQNGNPTDAANWKLAPTYYLKEANTYSFGQAGYIPNPDSSGHGYVKITYLGQ